MAAGALTHGLPATVDAGLLQGHKSWSAWGDAGTGAAHVPTPVTSRVSSSIQQALQSLTGRWDGHHTVSRPPNSRDLICTKRREPSMGTGLPSVGSRRGPGQKRTGHSGQETLLGSQQPPCSPGLPHPDSEMDILGMFPPKSHDWTFVFSQLRAAQGRSLPLAAKVARLSLSETETGAADCPPTFPHACANTADSQGSCLNFSLLLCKTLFTVTIYHS